MHIILLYYIQNLSPTYQCSTYIYSGFQKRPLISSNIYD